MNLTNTVQPRMNTDGHGSNASSRRQRHLLTTTLVVLLTVNAQLSRLQAQGTEFTYNGLLTDNGVPLNGLVELEATLWDAATNGNQITAHPLLQMVEVTNGLLTVALDFGKEAFLGPPRWLQIALRKNPDPELFTTLWPRQKITTVPYAIVAEEISGKVPIGGLKGSYSNVLAFDNPGNFFVGQGSGLLNLNASQLTSGTVPSAALGNAWKIGGNAGTTPGTHFLGTTDNQPLELRVNNQRVLRLEPNPDSPNVIGGFNGNLVLAGDVGSTIGGGGSLNNPNAIYASYATIAGGRNNYIFASDYGAIGGGLGNEIRSFAAAISGGVGNDIGANSHYSAIGGGNNNNIAANALFAAIPGGDRNFATNRAFAAGTRARASHTGAFVWADSQDADFASAKTNQFSVRAGGGARFVTGGAGMTLDGQPVVSGMVTAGQLADGAVTTGSIAAGAVMNTNLADGAVTASKMFTLPFSDWVVTAFTNPAPASGGGFGYSVAAVGTDRVLIGSPYDDTGAPGPGAAYLFGTNRTLLTTFTNPAPASVDNFGWSVAAVGSDRVLIGASGDPRFTPRPGAAYLFSTSGTLLTTFPNPTLASVGYFGYSVAAMGSDRVLISLRNGSGDAAYLFSTNGTLLFTFNSSLLGSFSHYGYDFGYAVTAVGTDRVLIGAHHHDAYGTNANAAGVAHLFSTNGTWLAPFINPAPADNDYFGWSVAAVGSDQVLIGAPGWSHGGADIAGAAYLFSTNGTLLKTFDDTAPGNFLNFGSSVAAVGSDRVLIGARADNTGAPYAGAAYLFSTDGTLLKTFTSPTPPSEADFGWSVAAVGTDRVLIGAYGDDTGTNNAGAAYLFSFESTGGYVPGLISAGVADHSITAASFDNSVGAWSKSAGSIFYNGGNVGIGTGTPTERLSVAGNITASGTITGNGAGLTALNASQLTSGTVPAVALGNAWKVGGNAGTTPNSHFLGTTDNQPLELRVNSTRAFRIEPGTALNIIGGSSNSVVTGRVGAVVGGGAGQTIDADYATIGGGRSNDIGTASSYSAISGGHDNNIAGSSPYSTLAGGRRNNIGVSAEYSFIGGGINNTIADNSGFSSIGGGRQNAANSGYSVIGGGSFHTISSNSFNNTIGGGWANSIRDGSHYSTIAGGQSNDTGTNSLGSAIGGGVNNSIAANASYSAIPGGILNDVGTNAHSSFIGGGTNNNIAVNSPYAAIGGGNGNNIGTNSAYATIPGGDRNFATNRAFAAGTRARANHTGAFVWADSTDADFASTGANQFLIRAAGGMGINVAQPLGKLHVGTSSNALPLSLASHTIIIDNAAENGRAAFLALAGPGGSSSTNRVELELEANESQRLGIIGTSSNHEVQFRQNNITRMRFHTNGNIGINLSSPSEQLHVNGNILATGTITPNSDRSAKTDLKPVDAAAVLERVAKLSIQQWRFKAEPDQTKHFGPMAQDFYAAFGLGSHETAIATVDADGVALAAIQGLNQKLEEQLQARDSEIRELRQGLAELKETLKNLATKTQE